MRFSGWSVRHMRKPEQNRIKLSSEIGLPFQTGAPRSPCAGMHGHGHKVRQPSAGPVPDSDVSKSRIQVVHDLPVAGERCHAPRVRLREQVHLPAGGLADGFRAEHEMTESIAPVAAAFMAKSVTGKAAKEDIEMSVRPGGNSGRDLLDAGGGDRGQLRGNSLRRPRGEEDRQD